MRINHKPLLIAGLIFGLTAGGIDGEAAESALPEPLDRVLSQAIAAGDASEITAVVRSMIKAHPDQEAAIQERLAEASTEAAQEALTAISAPETSAGAPSAAAQAAVAGSGEAEETTAASGFFGFSGWEGQMELGGTLNTGNTEEKTVSVAVRLDREVERWTHLFTTTFDFTRTDGVTSKHRFLSNYELSYDVSERSYTYGFVEYRDDRFSGYDYRVISSVGYGYNVIDEPTLGWELKGGPGVRYSALQAPDGSETEFVGRLASTLEWDISETATFTNELGLVVGTGTTTFDTRTAVTFQINSRLAAALSFETNTDTDPPAGAEKTDTTTKGSIVYRF